MVLLDQTLYLWCDFSAIEAHDEHLAHRSAAWSVEVGLSFRPEAYRSMSSHTDRESILAGVRVLLLLILRQPALEKRRKKGYHHGARRTKFVLQYCGIARTNDRSDRAALSFHNRTVRSSPVLILAPRLSSSGSLIRPRQLDSDGLGRGGGNILAVPILRDTT